MPPIFTQQQPTEVAPTPAVELPQIDGDTPPTLPGIVINNVPSAVDGNWWDTLTQPQATLSAGLFAIGAAWVAYAGVRRAQKSAEKSTKLQIKAAADLERDKHDREVLYEASSSAMAATILMRDAVLTLDRNERDGNILGIDPEEDEAADARRPELQQNLNRATDDVVGRAASLLILDAEDAYGAMMQFAQFCRPVATGIVPFNDSEFQIASVLAIDAVRNIAKREVDSTPAPVSLGQKIRSKLHMRGSL